MFTAFVVLLLRKGKTTYVCLPIVSCSGIFRECTFCLVSYHLSKEKEHLLSKLQSTPKSLFLYLKTLFEVYLSGTLNFSSIKVENVFAGSWERQNDGKISLDAYIERFSEFPERIRNNPVEVTDDIIELYLEVSLTANLILCICSLCTLSGQSTYSFIYLFRSGGAGVRVSVFVDLMTGCFTFCKKNESRIGIR